ncbi:PfkB family carbohydrate kinase [uncultured Intestinimonas sp.]|uniref:PfkB family carbohydrate kinase n=1 Tax=uncultured Intestinimonas sp. TaxID=1689265 RepID=UPI0025EBAC9E|nr:PfkB family carbohydrate kinase [uncultured Intestinimonas sp.]
MTQREAQILQWIQENPMISQQELADKAGITRSSAAVHISNLMKKGYIAGKGYIIRTAPYAVVVGGVNLDIGGTPFAPLVGQDSNPGRVRTSLGGVGRNIAHNMALLGLDVRLITALGDDLNAQKITTSCIELGIDLAPSLQVPGGTTSTYLFLTNEKGDMALAVSDMEIYDHLTPRYLSTKEQLLNNARLVVCDTNIPAETLQWIAENCRAPVFVDPVSTAKAGKVKPVLGRLHTLKPNRIEAELLSGVAITDDKSLSAAADALLATGLHRVFISLGGEGVYAADHLGGRVKVPCGPARMVNTTGCGDAFMAALAWGWLEGLGLEEAARAGLAASAIAMEGAETINPEMSAAALRRRLDLLPPAGPSEGGDAL